MNEDALKEMLVGLRDGETSVEDCLQRLKTLPFEDLGFACIDHHRGLRRGVSEVIFGENKDASDIISIMERMLLHGDNVLVTRLSADKARRIKERFSDAVHNEKARTVTLSHREIAMTGKGPILVMSAGTSDVPVAEEAAVTARFLGNEVWTVYDVGVSGLHRILSHRDRLLKAAVIVVVAGMEGALPSVVGGLVDKPVIAVPTSVGYGAGRGGIAALLGMLNSCAAGVTVVNIDNGFGAGYAASIINRS